MDLPWTKSTSIYILVVTLFVLTGKAASLQCYQCSASGPGSDCESNVDALADSRANDGPYSKNCTIEQENYCIIELSHNRGKISTFIRDCSDGRTFSFDTIPRLQKITPFNQTTCATYGTSGTVICMSLCRTDFCNGPQNSGSLSSGNFKAVCHVMLLYVLLLTEFLLKF